ncbi:zinc finger protein 746-like [Aphis craccivora]|uniref:Zinc finger protein 746-like n=1 Tax=Aphis craccivora TaxID=307492 RepID=A0A6G0WU00_APHCR|nr:zinc finger protein 746-like [Aphis craccivora]
MFKFDQCPSVFTRKDNLVAHHKTHTGIRFPCTICPSTFKYKHHLNRHYKNVHGFVNVPEHHRARENVITPQIQIA